MQSNCTMCACVATAGELASKHGRVRVLAYAPTPKTMAMWAAARLATGSPMLPLLVLLHSAGCCYP